MAGKPQNKERRAYARSGPAERRKRTLRRQEDLRMVALARHVDLLTEQIDHLVEIGLALSVERRVERLFEMVIEEARRISSADAGTVYRVSADGTLLRFVVLQNDAMGVYRGGTTGHEITLPPVSLYNEDGSPNHANVSSHVALSGEMVNIEDVYQAEGYDFTGTRIYDQSTGYRSRSMLVLPMLNHEGEIIGVLQLLNSKEPSGGMQAFPDEVVALVEALASQAAVALTNNQLIRDLKGLLYAFIKSIASAVDAKSPYTKGHIDRVVKLTMLLAQAANAQDEGPFADLLLNEHQMEELKLAAWMHDVGKVSTPEHVVDKSTRLETIFNRAELVRTRFELIGQALYAGHLERLLELHRAKTMINGKETEMARLSSEYKAARLCLDRERDFVLSCNNPAQDMTRERCERIREIGAKRFVLDGEEQPYLTKDEMDNLCIPRGSLNEVERGIIENHALVTRDMLGQLPFPKHLENVPAYASRHHEKLDGSGYPDGLTAKDLPLQARIMAVADIFEALTAKDRPYKKPMKLTEALSILEQMRDAGKIDPDVYDLFVQAKIYLEYGVAELRPDQLDVG